MKKFAAVLLTGIMVFSMAACGGNGNDAGSAETTAEVTTGAADDAETTAASDETAAEKDDSKLIMATEAGFAPYEYTEDGETVVGVDVDIANEIAKAMGKELEIQNMNFDSALLSVQQGKVDFAAAGNAREGRADGFFH